jgi:hypothetical protein
VPPPQAEHGIGQHSIEEPGLIRDVAFACRKSREPIDVVRERGFDAVRASRRVTGQNHPGPEGPPQPLGAQRSNRAFDWRSDPQPPCEIDRITNHPRGCSQGLGSLYGLEKVGAPPLAERGVRQVETGRSAAGCCLATRAPMIMPKLIARASELIAGLEITPTSSMPIVIQR